MGKIIAIIILFCCFGININCTDNTQSQDNSQITSSGSEDSDQSIKITWPGSKEDGK